MTRPRGRRDADLADRDTDIVNDSTSTSTRRRSSQIRRAASDTKGRSRRHHSTQRGNDVGAASAIVAALVLLIILFYEFSFWRLPWPALLSFWRLLWGMALLSLWLLLRVAALVSFWLLLWVALPAMTVFVLIGLVVNIVIWVCDRLEVPRTSYLRAYTSVGNNAPSTTGRGGEESNDSVILKEELANLPKKFSLKKLKEATNSFATNRILGEGGFGKVYKGHIDRKPVAVKKITSSLRGVKEQYEAEVNSLSQLRHINLVQLIGYCHEEKKFVLVYEFIGGGSLEDHLFEDRPLLTWEKRRNIALGLASALDYLHNKCQIQDNKCQQCVIHRDIKSSNVMLNEQFVAKLGDFGLAKLVDCARGLSTTQLAGTPGYWAPEYFRMGQVSKESDIYSFGVVLLEILCGKRVSDSELAEQGSLVQWVWKRSGCGRSCFGRWFRNFHLPVDERLGKDFDKKQAEALMIVGLLCAHPIASSRLSIEAATAILNLTVEPPKLPSKIPSFNI